MSVSVGSMFTGIAGFEIGLAAVWDIDVAWQAEIDPYCCRLLAERFPGVPNLGDVTAATPTRVYVLTAGFPCQPVSQAGKRLAQADERWLWPEVARFVRLAEPTLVLLENVRGLRNRGLNVVLADLHELGYDAQFDLIPAAAVGAPHLRHRFWIVAYPVGTEIGQVFAGPPPVLPWRPEPRPRLSTGAYRRRDRLTALGNAVVPQNVAALALLIDRARAAGAYVPPSLFGTPIREANPAAMPVAGALLDGMLHEQDTSAPKVDGRLWPSPSASNPNEREPLEAWLARRAAIKARGINGNGFGIPLGVAVRMEAAGRDDVLWPTPHGISGGRADGGYDGHGSELSMAVRVVEGVSGSERSARKVGLWPTPQASDGTGGRVSSQEVRETGRRPSGTKASVTLGDAVHQLDGLWPTPMAADGDRSSHHGVRFYAGGGDSPTLLGAAARADEAEKLWPTATASDASMSRRATARRDDWTSNTGTTLLDAVYEDEGVDPHMVEGQRADGSLLWPTAAASDYKGCSRPGQRRGQLEEAVKDRDGLWPTPKASPSGPDYARAGRADSGGDDLATAAARANGGTNAGGLEPTWVEWLMGYPHGWTDNRPRFDPAAAA